MRAFLSFFSHASFPGIKLSRGCLAASFLFFLICFFLYAFFDGEFSQQWPIWRSSQSFGLLILFLSALFLGSFHLSTQSIKALSVFQDQVLSDRYWWWHLETGAIFIAISACGLIVYVY